jgi:hypothetical protein
MPTKAVRKDAPAEIFDGAQGRKTRLESLSASAAQPIRWAQQGAVEQLQPLRAPLALFGDL